MFNLGWTEVVIIILAAIIIFGPKKIPELGGAIGKTLRGFKEEVKKSAGEDESSEQDFEA